MAAPVRILLLTAALLLPAVPLLRAADAPPRPGLRPDALAAAGLPDNRHPTVTWKVIDHQTRSLGGLEYWDILLERHESAGRPGLITRVVEKSSPRPRSARATSWPKSNGASIPKRSAGKKPMNNSWPGTACWCT